MCRNDKRGTRFHRTAYDQGAYRYLCLDYPVSAKSFKGDVVIQHNDNMKPIEAKASEILNTMIQHNGTYAHFDTLLHKLTKMTGSISLKYAKI